MEAERIDGLGEREWRALANALTVHRDDRTPSVSQFLDEFGVGSSQKLKSVVATGKRAGTCLRRAAADLHRGRAATGAPAPGRRRAGDARQARAPRHLRHAVRAAAPDRARRRRLVLPGAVARVFDRPDVGSRDADRRGTRTGCESARAGPRQARERRSSRRRPSPIRSRRWCSRRARTCRPTRMSARAAGDEPVPAPPQEPVATQAQPAPPPPAVVEPSPGVAEQAPATVTPHRHRAAPCCQCDRSRRGLRSSRVS